MEINGEAENNTTSSHKNIIQKISLLELLLRGQNAHLINRVFKHRYVINNTEEWPTFSVDRVFINLWKTTGASNQVASQKSNTCKEE